MTLGIVAAPSMELLSREPTSAMPERDLFRTPDAERPEEAHPRPGDGPPLTEADLFAAYSIGVQEGPR